MNKIIIAVLAFLFLETTNAYGQDSLLNKFGSLLRPDNAHADHISRVLEGGIYLVKSTFVIKSTKTGREFGKAKYKNHHFGQQYTVGVSAKKQLWIPPSVLEPWRVDSAYKEYGDTIQPVLKDATWRVFNDTASPKLFDLGKAKMSQKWQFTHTDLLDSSKNLTMPNDLPTANCWLLTYYADEDEKIKSLTTSVTPVWDKNNQAPIAKPFLTPKGKLIGGVLVKEIITFGKIEVQLVGLYFFDGTQWIAQAPLLDNQLGEQIGTATTDPSADPNNIKPKGSKPKKEDKPRKKDEPKKKETPNAPNNSQPQKDDKTLIEKTKNAIKNQ